MVDTSISVNKVYRMVAEHHIRLILIAEDGRPFEFVSVKDLMANPVLICLDLNI